MIDIPVETMLEIIADQVADCRDLGINPNEFVDVATLIRISNILDTIINIYEDDNNGDY